MLTGKIAALTAFNRENSSVNGVSADVPVNCWPSFNAGLSEKKLNIFSVSKFVSGKIAAFTQKSSTRGAVKVNFIFISWMCVQRSLLHRNFSETAQSIIFNLKKSVIWLIRSRSTSLKNESSPRNEIHILVFATTKQGSSNEFHCLFLNYFDLKDFDRRMLLS